jgi:hypothetical protein
MVTSAVLAIAIGFLATQSPWLVLALVLLHAVSVNGDSGALTSGMSASAYPTSRGATLALHSTVGFGMAAVGAWATGAALDAAGGPMSASGWTAAFALLSFSILLGPIALWWSRRGEVVAIPGQSVGMGIGVPEVRRGPDRLARQRPADHAAAPRAEHVPHGSLQVAARGEGRGQVVLDDEAGDDRPHRGLQCATAQRRVGQGEGGADRRRRRVVAIERRGLAQRREERQPMRRHARFAQQRDRSHVREDLVREREQVQRRPVLGRVDRIEQDQVVEHLRRHEVAPRHRREQSRAREELAVGQFMEEHEAPAERRVQRRHRDPVRIERHDAAARCEVEVRGGERVGDPSRLDAHREREPAGANQPSRDRARARGDVRRHPLRVVGSHRRRRRPFGRGGERRCAERQQRDHRDADPRADVRSVATRTGARDVGCGTAFGDAHAGAAVIACPSCRDGRLSVTGAFHDSPRIGGICKRSRGEKSLPRHGRRRSESRCSHRPDADRGRRGSDHHRRHDDAFLAHPLGRRLLGRPVACLALSAGGTDISPWGGLFRGDRAAGLTATVVRPPHRTRPGIWITRPLAQGARRMRVSSALALTLTLTLAVLPAAAVAAGGNAATLYGGYRAGGGFTDTNSGQSVDVEGSGAFSATLDFPTDAAREIRLLVSYQSSRFDVGSQPAAGTATLAGRSTSVTYFHLGGTYFYEGRIGAGPYLLGGLGATLFQPSLDGYSSEWRPSMSLGIGYLLPLGAQVSLRFEARGYVTLVNSEGGFFCSGGCVVSLRGDTFTQGEALLGLSVRF